MSLDDVAKVTKIQPRILERLEAGKLDGLPAEVFVRGFVRSFARCVGLDEREALRRYAACALGSQDLAPTVRALVEVMADLAPGSATAARATPRKMHAVEVIDLAGPVPGPVLLTPPPEPEAPNVASAASDEPPGSHATAEPSLAGAGEGGQGGPLAEAEAPLSAELTAPVATAVEAPPEAPAAQAIEPGAPIASSEPVSAAPGQVAASVAEDPPAFGSRSEKKRARRRKARAAAAAAAAAAASHDAAGDAAGMLREPLAVGTPPTASPVVAPTAGEAPRVPWRRSARQVAAAPAAPARPSLVIDDADPESAERVQEERAEHAETMAPRRSFLPPILLDREDRSARQGGLTLAVILLLIAATLTLSYLMRRPSASGDGMTGREAPAQRAERS